MPTTTAIACKWSAVHDFMPPHPPRLNVFGECTTPTPGYKIELKEAVPQGINPLILLLEKTVIPPTGIEPQHLATAEASFTLETNTHYTEVVILPDDIKIKVEDVT
jgi:hypothetical protein